jgi:hypothetical protein
MTVVADMRVADIFDFVALERDRRVYSDSVCGFRWTRPLTSDDFSELGGAIRSLCPKARELIKTTFFLIYKNNNTLFSWVSVKSANQSILCLLKR